MIKAIKRRKYMPNFTVQPRLIDFKMKVVFFVAVLLFGCSYAKPHSAKRSLTCSGFPRQFSGRLYVTEVLDSGASETSDIHFNLDLNRQLFQADATVQGQSYVIFVDYENHKSYVVYPGGCLASDMNEELPGFQDLSASLRLVASGKLGLNGASVNLYSYEKDERSGIVTLEGLGDDQCIPVNFASKQNRSASTGSFLDLQTTVDSEKLNIPEECENQGENNEADVRRALPAIFHTARLKEAIKRVFPWIPSKKRGFPWMEDASSRKRGFPWIDDASVLKRGFPWIEK